MAKPMLEQRVDRLEDLMADMLRAQAEMIRESALTSREMRLFKKESQAARADMERQWVEWREQSDRQTEQRTHEWAEWREHNDREAERRDREAEQRQNELAEWRRNHERELVEWRERRDREFKDSRKQWGELSRKMGTMAEDLVAPSVPHILRTVVGCPNDQLDSMAVRVFRASRLDRSCGREFDVVAVHGVHVLVNETKAKLVPADVDAFVTALRSVREYLWEAEGRRVIGAIASLYVDPSLACHAEKNGLIVLGFGEDLMDVLNTPGFKPTEF